jgi:two-component system response regulator VanR
MKKILIVEDEQDIRDLLHSYLTNEGYEVSTAADGVEAISLFSKGAYDLVILDIMIPKIDGYSVCEVIKKQSDIPVVFLSALNDERSQIKGYDKMADDYVTKPFSMPVFLRKVNALIRRNEASGGVDNHSVCVCGDIVINKDTMEVSVCGKPVTLTVREFDLLLTLAKNPGRIYTRELLLDLLWDYDSLVDERIVDTHIKNLRHKLGGEYIETVRGRGYRIAKKDI